MKSLRKVVGGRVIHDQDDSKAKQVMTDITEFEEIVALLKRVIQSKEKVRIWFIEDGIRIYHYAYPNSYNQTKNTIIFRSLRNDKFSFKNGSTIFFHSPEKEVIFKTTVKSNDTVFLELELPVMVKCNECRAEKRIRFGLKSEHYAQVFCMNKYKEKLNVKLKVLDTSTNGCALLISSSLFNTLEVNDKLMIKRLSCDKEEDLVFVIRNKAPLPINVGATISYRIGLEKLTMRENPVGR